MRPGIMAEEILRLRPSLRLQWTGLALHVLAAVAVLLADIPWYGAVGAYLALAVSAGWCLREQRFPRYQTMVLMDGVVRLEGRDGAVGVSPPEVRFRAGRLLVLRFRRRTAGRRQHYLDITLAGDSLTAGEHRRLWKYLTGWHPLSAAH